MLASTFESITNPTMKPEEFAWRSLQQHAASQLRTGFADRVIRTAQGPRAEAWHALTTKAAAQIRPGFAERVLRAARAVADAPSLASQFALSAVTAAICLGAVVLVHHHISDQADERNLAEWAQIVAVARDLDSGGL